MEYLLFEVSKRISERHSQRSYLKRLNEGIHIIKSAQATYLDFLSHKQEDLKQALENVTFFRTNLNPTEKEMQKMALFKLETTHLKKMKAKKMYDMPAGIEHEIVGDVSISYLEQVGVIEKLTYGFRRETKQGLNLHYSHSKDSGWKFEVIFSSGKNKDLIGQFQLDNKEFIDVKRTANSEARLEVKEIGVFKLGPFIMFLNSKVRENIF